MQYLLKYLGPTIIDAWGKAYSYHCDPMIVKKYFILLPKIVSQIESSPQNQKVLLSLKYFLHLYNWMRLPDPGQTDIQFNMDFIRLNWNCSQKVLSDQQKCIRINSDNFSLKDHALCVRSFFRLSKEVDYCTLVCIKDKSYKQVINIALTNNEIEKRVEHYKNDTSKTIIISIPAAIQSDQWIWLTVYLIRMDEFK